MIGEQVARLSYDVDVAAIYGREDVDLPGSDEREARSIPSRLVLLVVFQLRRRRGSLCYYHM